MTLDITHSYVLSLDYLGTAGTDANGYIAINNHWYFGRNQASGGADQPMVNDGTWHHYSVGFSGSLYPTASIWVEDFFGQSTSLGNAYFDNISLVDTTTGQTVFLENSGQLFPSPEPCYSSLRA